MKIFKKLAIKIFAPVLTILIAFVGIGFLFDAKISADKAKVASNTRKRETIEEIVQKAESYVPSQDDAFYAAYNNLSSTEYSEPNENGEYDLAKLGSVVINLTEANKSALASIGLKEDAVDTKANATLSATLEHGKMNIVVSCQYGNRYLEASTDAEGVLGEHFTGGAPVKLSGTKILTNNNRNSLMAVTLHDAKIAEVTGGTFTFSNAVYGGANSSNRITGRGIYISGGTAVLGTEVCIKCYNANALSSNKYGAGVYVAGGDLQMNGGTIYDCYAYEGGGVCCDNGSFNMVNGTIEACQAVYDGGGFYDRWSGSLHTICGTITGNIAGTSGGGISCLGESTLEIEDGAVISGNRANDGYGGGIYGDERKGDVPSINLNGHCIIGASMSGHATSSSCSNYASSDGGGIHLQYGTLSFSAGSHGSPVIAGNYAGGKGGGMYLYSVSGGVTNVSGGWQGASVTNNGAYSGGGGIYIGEMTGTFTGFTISENYAGNGPGGGIYCYGNFGSLTLYQGEISDNYGAGAGGGIYMENTQTYNNASNYPTLTLASIEINNNEAGAGTGGGIYAKFINMIINDYTEINDNHTDLGGGIYFWGDSIFNTFLMQGGIVGENLGSYATTSNRGNYADQGGGIYFTGSVSATIAYDEKDGNTTPQVMGNYADDGAGIYTSSPSCNISLAYAEIMYNTATANGGGIYVAGNSSQVGGSSGAATYAKINNNKANNGGGLYMSNSYGTLNYMNISNNYATTNGGGIYAIATSSVKTIQIGSSCVVGNSSASARASSGTNSNYAGNCGGGIYASNYIGLSLQGTICQCYAEESGGGVCITDDHNGTVTVSGATINYNVAYAGDGGGIYMSTDDANFSMTSGVIRYNTAGDSGDPTGDGGGIYFGGAGSFSISGSSTYIGSSVSSLSGCAGSSCSNRAGSDGGGIYIGSGSGSVTISGSGVVIGYNSAGVGYGGGIYSARSISTFRAKVLGNSAYSGGGIACSGATLSLGYSSSSVYTQIKYNKATSNGGGIYASGSSSVTFDGNNSYGIIGYNQAANGGGIYSTNSALAVTSGKIQYNNATSNGGGVYFYVGSSTARTFTFSGGYIGYEFETQTTPTTNTYNGTNVRNRAGSYGGGIYISSYSSSYKATLSYSGGFITGNAANYGGGIYGGSYSTINMTSSSCYVSNNYAAYHGGGFYLTGSGQTTNIYGGYVGRSSTSCATSSSYSNRALYGAGICVNGTYPTLKIYSSSSSVYGIVRGNYATGHGGGVYIPSATVYIYGYARIDYNLADASTTSKYEGGTGTQSYKGSGVYYGGASSFYIGGYIQVVNNYYYVNNESGIFMDTSTSYLRGNATTGSLQSTSAVQVFKNGATAGTAQSTSYIFQSTSSYYSGAMNYLKVIYPYDANRLSTLNYTTSGSTYIVYIKDRSNNYASIELVERPIISHLTIIGLLEYNYNNFDSLEINDSEKIEEIEKQSVTNYVKKVEKQLWIDEKQRILGTKHPWIVSVDENTDTDKLVV